MEIERKFLLKNDNWRGLILRSKRMKQGYICTDPAHTLRVRISDNEAWLTLKGQAEGIARHEYEFAIPVKQAEEIYNIFCADRQIDKTRHYLQHHDHQWEIDEFFGCLSGLITAEIELQSIDEYFAAPEWLGREVSDDPRYCNSNLARLKNLDIFTMEHKMNERRFNGEIDKLRSAERKERLQINRVVDYSLAGIDVKSVVDIGTGSGVFAEAFKNRDLIVRGVDCNPEFLKIAAELLPDVEFKQAVAEKLPYDNLSCDLVFMGHLLHETDNAEMAMQEAFRITRQRLAVLEWPYLDQEVGPPIDHRMPVEKIKALGLHAGFTLCDVIQLRLMQLVIFDR